MHIVVDARESGTSTGRYVDKLIEHLHALQPEHNFSLLVRPHRQAYLQKIAPNFAVVPCNVKEFTFAEQGALKQQIEGLHPDLVHFPMVQQPVFYKGSVVTTMQDLTTVRFRNPAKNIVVFWLKQQVYKWLNKRVARKSAVLITPTEYVKQDVAAYCHVPLEKISVTLEAADVIPDAAEPTEGLAGKQFILYTGRPTPHKNLGRLIDAFVLLQKTHPNLYLVLVGKHDANYARHEAQVRYDGVRNVVFTGFVSDGQLRWLYENCAAYVFPSLSEGFGLPGLEAMAHGAPVVSSNTTCLPEVNGDAAHYFDPLNTEDIAAKIADVLDDETLRSNLIKKGTERVKQFSWQRMAKQTLEVYERALEDQ